MFIKENFIKSIIIYGVLSPKKERGVKTSKK